MDDTQFSQDAEDRRAALRCAVDLALESGNHSGVRITADANYFYAWLRWRDTMRAVSIVLQPGTSSQEGTSAMATTFEMADNDQVTFTLDGKDAKGADVPSPSDSLNWSLADPDGSGAVLTVSGDTLSAVVAAGTATANLVLSAAGQSSGLSGQCAITITAGPAVAVDLVPGTPTPV